MDKEEPRLIIGAYGLFWQRNLVDWQSHSWRMLGRQGLNKGTIQIVDFRRARGVYVLYDDVGVYYVGLASGVTGIGGRLKDHLNDQHDSRWTRFSWFAFDRPGDASDDDGVTRIEQYDSVDVETPVLRDRNEIRLQIRFALLGGLA